MMKTTQLSMLRGIGLSLWLVGTPTLFAQDPLDSWVRRPVPSPNPPLQAVAFGNGTFVAVGDSSTVARSANGAVWTSSTVGSYGDFKRVRFLDGQFFVVGTSDKLLVSSDGTSWNPVNLPQADFWDIAWGAGRYVIAGSKTYVSTNGTDWVQTHPIVNIPGNTYETPLDTVVYGNGLFLALPTGGSSPLLHLSRQTMMSTNGVDWIYGGPAPTSNTGGNSELLFADGRWLAVGNSVIVSTNAASLCCDSGGFPGDSAGDLAHGQGTYLWVNSPFFTRAWTSTDGLSWQLRYETSERVDVRGAAFGHGTFVVVGLDEAGASYVLQSGNISGVPTFLQEPLDRGAVTGNPATFTVRAVGASPLAYQWYRNGTAIPNATNALYTIASVQASDSGGFHVVVSNALGSISSRVAQLTVAFLEIHSYAGITVLGVPGRTYRIDATLANGPPNWQAITNLVLPSSPHIWIDYDSPGMPSRLYRAAELP